MGNTLGLNVGFLVPLYTTPSNFEKYAHSGPSIDNFGENSLVRHTHFALFPNYLKKFS